MIADITLIDPEHYKSIIGLYPICSVCGFRGKEMYKVVPKLRDTFEICPSCIIELDRKISEKSE